MSSDDTLKAIVESLAATRGQDPLNLSPEEAALAAKLISKIMKPQDPVRVAIGRITGDMLQLLLDASTTRESNNGTLDLIKNSCVAIFTAWMEEEGEARVGNLLGAYYLTFDERFKGSPEDAMKSGKEAVAWLLNELDLNGYIADNPLIVDVEDSASLLSTSEEDEEDLGPF